MDPTMSAILNFSSDKLAQEVSKNRDQLFLQGMQKAASGQALTEIVNDRPWYSKIFGDGPLVEGARTFEASTRAAQWKQGMVDAMPDLRKVSPEALPQKLDETLAPLLTGDETADAQIRMKVLSEFPDIVKLHTKENYQYLQEEASRKAGVNLRTQAASFQQTMTADPAKVDNVMRLKAKQAVFQAADPAGRNDPEWLQATASSLIEMGKDGNWYAVQAFKDAGFFDQLQPQQRTALESTLEAQARASHSQPQAQAYQLAAERIRQKAAADGETYSGYQAMADLKALNEKYAADTGNPLPLLNTAQVTDVAGSAMSLQYRMLAAEREATKAKYGDPGLFLMAKEWAMRGMTQEGINTDLLPNEKMKLAFQEVLTSMQGKPDQQIELIVGNAKGGYVHQAISDRLKGTLSALPDEPTADFRWAYQQFLDMRKNPDGAIATSQYFGAEMDARLGVLQMLDAANPQAFQSNYQMAMRSPKVPEALTDKELNELSSTTASSLGLSQTALMRSPSVQRMLKQTGGAYKTYGMALGQDAWAKNAGAIAQANGLESFGDYAWVAPGWGTRTRPLGSMLSISGPEVSSGIDDVLKDKLPNGAPSDLIVVRNADVMVDGKPQATFSAYTGNTRINFTGNDIQAKVRAAEIRDNKFYGRTTSRPFTGMRAGEDILEQNRLRRQPLPNAQQRN